MKPTPTPDQWSDMQEKDLQSRTDAHMIKQQAEPGPWFADEDRNGCPIVTDNEYCVAQLMPKYATTTNSALISAAPNLLEACEHAVKRLKELDSYRNTDSSASIGLILKAIAKAKGVA